MMVTATIDDALGQLLPYHEQDTANVIEDIYCDKAIHDIPNERLRDLMDAAAMLARVAPPELSRTEVIEGGDGSAASANTPRRLPAQSAKARWADGI